MGVYGFGSYEGRRIRIKESWGVECNEALLESLCFN